ncbi:hypothetical protein ABZY44_00590 [Streptomyces sp. NPDC006544]|uniref:hypothetical protein n=1 Tax=Streptomyces sp. NPDC006544 TaxID=3154583 RepID=UPI0033BB1657
MDAQVLAAEIVPFAVTAVSTYGAAVLTRLEVAAADGTVSLGHRLIQRLLSRQGTESGIESAVTDLAEDPNDPDLQAVLRVRIKAAILADAELANELREMLGQGATSIVASGERSVAANVISGIVSTGDSATIQR